MVLKIAHLLFQLFADVTDGALHLVLGGDIVAGRVDRHMLQGAYRPGGDRMKLGDAVDLVTEKLHANGAVFIIRRIQLHRVPADTEHIAAKGNVVALVTAFHQSAQQLVPVKGHAGAQGDHHFGKVLRLTQTVNTAHRRHHDHIPALQQRAGGA